MFRGLPQRRNYIPQKNSQQQYISGSRTQCKFWVRGRSSGANWLHFCFLELVLWQCWEQCPGAPLPNPSRLGGPLVTDSQLGNRERRRRVRGGGAHQLIAKQQTVSVRMRDDKQVSSAPAQSQLSEGNGIHS
jgi:hypothetical protein